MRWYAILVFVALFFAGPVRASLEELAAALPSCALPCFTEAISQSSCAPTNQTCMCTNEDFTGMVELCVLKSCSIREALTTKNVSATNCGAPIRDRTKAVSIAGLAGGALALLAFCLRIIARLPCCGGTIGMDDWTMALTMLCVIPISILSYVLAEDGLGKDMWVVPFDNITHILYIYFFDECLYLTGIALTKISILCFYLRVFPRREFRILVYIAIGINVAYIIVFDLISIFQCSPVQGAWHRWDETGDYKCNNINAQGWSSAAVNMALDIMVMALPIKELYGLNLSWRRKVFVMCMFSLGIFVTLVSIIRLESLIVFANTTNLTWDYVQIGYWSTIEIHVGVICACLPAIRALFRRIWPRMFGDTDKGISKGSRSRSVGTGSRNTGIGLASPRKHADDHFVPLVDMGDSSQLNLTSESGPRHQGWAAA
ncbi:hypothetical protein ASPCAL01694 [Aspergillus calidoustus]|uniref:CFEM domain-containing protein n=1 Tax=Aspergillus calidoustus TaxID=454130 RepID=A0A0U5GIL5_ASPCI|nr:hypothetical protein ASPCAL01694 [Aspergillus calidoustus]